MRMVGSDLNTGFLLSVEGLSTSGRVSRAMDRRWSQWFKNHHSQTCLSHGLQLLCLLCYATNEPQTSEMLYQEIRRNEFDSLTGSKASVKSKYIRCFISRFQILAEKQRASKSQSGIIWSFMSSVGACLAQSHPSLLSGCQRI